MARPKQDLHKKAEEIKLILEKYGGIPTQQQDRAAYATVSYYIKNYANTPPIQELISRFNINIERRTRTSSCAQISEISEILKEKGRLPSVKEDESLYTKIRYVFKKHQDIYEVIRLKYIYAHSSCYPLPDTKYGPKPEYLNNDLFFSIGFVPDGMREWLDNTTYEYIEYVYNHFGELPGLETKPMVRLQKKIRSLYVFMGLYMREDEKKRLKDFLQRMMDYGCEDSLIKELYYSFRFDSEEVQERVRQMVIENGACAIHYIAQTAIPECALSDLFVYRYYYYKFTNKNNSIYHTPLGKFPAHSSNPNRVLRVHYRDYDKCDVNKIRESAISHYRNWIELQPTSLEDWKYYGQCAFFSEKITYSESINDSVIDWSKTYIENQRLNGEEYFYWDNNDDIYRDYCDYLVENGFKPQSKVLLRIFNKRDATDGVNNK